MMVLRRRRTAFVPGDLFAGLSGFQRSDTPFSIQRRMAADRVIARSAAHASIRLTRSRGRRIARTGSRPVAGLPLFFGNTFLLDPAMFLVTAARVGVLSAIGGQPQGDASPVVGVGRAASPTLDAPALYSVSMPSSCIDRLAAWPRSSYLP